MALVDRISFDSSGMDAGKLTAFLKGLAFRFRSYTDDSETTLDISNPSALNQALKAKIAETLISWKEDAENYERDRDAAPVDISDA